MDPVEHGHSPAPTSDPLLVLDGVPLSEEEELYAGAARAANTLRGYRSDWREWCGLLHRCGPASREARRPTVDHRCRP